MAGSLTYRKKFVLVNTYHVTYEHSHPVIVSKGMLDRKQTYNRFFKIIIKDLVKFYLRIVKYNFLFYKNDLKN